MSKQLSSESDDSVDSTTGYFVVTHLLLFTGGHRKQPHVSINRYGILWKFINGPRRDRQEY